MKIWKFGHPQFSVTAPTSSLVFIRRLVTDNGVRNPTSWRHVSTTLAPRVDIAVLCCCDRPILSTFAVESRKCHGLNAAQSKVKDQLLIPQLINGVSPEAFCSLCSPSLPEKLTVAARPVFCIWRWVTVVTPFCVGTKLSCRFFGNIAY